MKDHLADLAKSARARVDRGYYDSSGSSGSSSARLSENIYACQYNPIIAEIKFQSPSAGKIRDPEDILSIATSMIKGGACAISMLTDPDNFGGNLEFLAVASRELPVPVVMKDIVVSPRQAEAASRAGASAIVLISEIFSRNLSETSLENMIDMCRDLGLETLLEANGLEEFSRIREYSPALYGINNRNLSTFQVDLSTTSRILSKHPGLGRPVVAESGIESAADVTQLKAAGASAFLVGTSIMRSENVEAKVRELVNA